MATNALEKTSQLQYLTFMLNSEFFGVDILRVQEIRGWTGARKIPNMPDFIKGVLNLRGKVVPIIDLRLRFGVDEVDYVPTTVVIVVTIEVPEEGIQTVGIVVDAVADVIIVEPDDFKDSPPLGVNVDTRFIQGVVVRGDEITVIVDMDCILLEQEALALSEIKT